MPIQPAIQCQYSCFQCGIYRAPFTVAQRDGEDVVEWLDKVAAPAASAAHDLRSPHCHITKLSELLIPAPAGTTRIGTLPPPAPTPPRRMT